MSQSPLVQPSGRLFLVLNGLSIILDHLEPWPKDSHNQPRSTQPCQYQCQDDEFQSVSFSACEPWAHAIWHYLDRPAEEMLPLDGIESVGRSFPWPDISSSSDLSPTSGVLTPTCHSGDRAVGWS